SCVDRLRREMMAWFRIRCMSRRRLCRRARQRRSVPLLPLLRLPLLCRLLVS
ncbi:hypothetical protein EV176_001846, partial [Coemansia sp. RSA 451]